MNRTVRGLIFWTFIVFFLVAAPLSVLYTAGFRYNTKNGSFVRTGVISVTSIPRNAEIFLNGEDTNKATPFVLKRVLPGKYDIELSRNGFHSWSGTTEVESGQTAELQSVLLFKDVDPVQHVIREAEILAPSPDGRYVAFVITEGGWEEIWMFDTESAQPRLIDRLTAAEQDEAVELLWSADGSRLIVNNRTDGTANAYTNSGDAVEIPADVLDGYEDIFWHPSQGSILYVSTAEELRQLDFATGSLTEFTDNSAASVLIDASILTFVDNGTQIELRQSVSEDTELIALLPRADYTIVERDASLIILTDKRENLLLIDIRADQPILLETKAHVFDWNAGADQLVFSDGNEVNIYSPGTHTTEFVTRQSAFIESIAWHPSGGAVIVGTKTNLSAIEARAIGQQRFITSLMDAQEIEQVWMDTGGKTAFFYGTIEGARGIYSLELTR